MTWKTFVTAVLAVKDKSSLMEDIEYQHQDQGVSAGTGGAVKDGGGDNKTDTDTKIKTTDTPTPTLQYDVATEIQTQVPRPLKNGATSSLVHHADGDHPEDKNKDKADKTKVTKEIAESEGHRSGSTRKNLLVLLLIFGLSLTALLFVYTTFPELEESERAQLMLPKSIEDAKILGDILVRYRDKYYPQVLTAVFAIYIFLQTFAIPGSIFLSIISGFLFSYPLALLLICFCSATGASLCYALSFLLGRRIIYKYFPARAESWSKTVEKHRDNLLLYIIFLRITPFLPNWFINITSPIINVPIIPFWIGTFIGVAPPSILAVQAGTTLHLLTSSSDAISWKSLLVLAGLGFLVLLPAIFKNRLKSKFE